MNLNISINKIISLHRDILHNYKVGNRNKYLCIVVSVVWYGKNNNFVQLTWQNCTHEANYEATIVKLKVKIISIFLNMNSFYAS